MFAAVQEGWLVFWSLITAFFISGSWDMRPTEINAYYSPPLNKIGALHSLRYKVCGSGNAMQNVEITVFVGYTYLSVLNYKDPKGEAN